MYINALFIRRQEIPDILIYAPPTITRTSEYIEQHVWKPINGIALMGNFHLNRWTLFNLFGSRMPNETIAGLN